MTVTISFFFRPGKCIMTDMNNEQAGTDVPLNFDELAQTMNEFEISIARDTALVADLQSLKVSVEALGGIDRSVATAMELLSPGMLNTDRFPINGYTQSPSRTNYTHAMEAADSTGRNIGQRIWDAIVNAFKLIWKILNRLLTGIFMNEDSVGLKHVAKLQAHIKDTLQKLPSTDRHAAQVRMHAIAADPISAIGSSDYDRINTVLGSDVADSGRLYSTSILLFGTLGVLVPELVTVVSELPKLTDEQCNQHLAKPSILLSKGVTSILHNAGIHAQSEHVDSIANGLIDFKNDLHAAKTAVASNVILDKLFKEHSGLLKPMLKDARGLLNDAKALQVTINHLDKQISIIGTELPAKRDLIKRTFREITALMSIVSIYHAMETYQRTAVNGYIKLLKAQIRAIRPRGESHDE